MTEHERLNHNEKFKELGALANSGTLTASEWADLKRHLEICTECRQVYDQYLILANEAIPLLDQRYGDQEERGSWKETPTREKLFARVQAAEKQAFSTTASQARLSTQPNLLGRILVTPLQRVG